jgi:3-hydroxyacyl-CoA dehydrogenase / enoyl-CoA hydratase / 3-hydroxybutyryl-CoA epimerase
MAYEVSELKDWRFSIDYEGIAWAVFDRAGESANALGRRPLEELMAIVGHVEMLARDTKIAGLGLLSGKENGFIVGADIREFDALDSEAKVIEAIKPVTAMLDRIEQMPAPVVCGIHGVSVGGGLELALACHYRIGTRDDSTRVGFPEVKLGLFPGFNGTARAIRQVGALAAMQSMLTGTMIGATPARGLGFLDEVVGSPHQLKWAVRRAILEKRRSRPAIGLRAILAQWPTRGFLAKKLRTETKKKVREDHYPAPFRLIDLFERYGGDYESLKQAETRAVAPLVVGDTSRNLRRVFRLSELLKAQAPKELKFKPLRVHVIGAGTMGADIAGWCVASGMEVSLQDISVAQIRKGIQAQDKLFSRKYRSKVQRDAAKARFLPDPSGVNIARADVVIEAIVEKLEAKRSLFEAIEGKLKPGAVLATNTSSITIEEIAAQLTDPSRLIGLHFFNPVPQMPLVEIVRGAQCRDEEVNKGAAFVTAIGKLPLVVKSVPGFLVNRVLAPYLNGAMQRFDQGEEKEKIDEAARTFGMPMGPIELADAVGLDVCAHVGKILKFGGVGSKLDQLASAGKLGKKSGEGFYRWKDGKPQKGDKTYDKGELERLGRELVEPLIAECERCRDERVVESADHVDAGVIFGTGFAPFRGGPLHFKSAERASRAEPRRAAAE